MPEQTADNFAAQRNRLRRSAGLPIHVLVVDDHPTLRRALALLIGDQPDLAVIGEAATAVEALRGPAHWADVAVIDYHLGGHNGLWLARRLQEHPRAPRVLIYSAFADHGLALAATIAGADGLLSKDALGGELCVAIRRVASGRRSLPSVPASLSGLARARLESRDQAIFDMLLYGLPAGQIAAHLAVARTAVEARRDAILGVIAPSVRRPGVPRAQPPLDCQRARRRPRYGAA
jgi:two-component system, NarL family, response regulator DevR